MEFLNKLKLAKFKFVIRAEQPLWLPSYKGSTFRGAFGSTFRRIVCVMRDQECDTCMLRENCAYYYVFESPNPMTLSNFTDPKIPHPFILEPPLERELYFPVGAELDFHLILVGKAIDYLPYFIHTFDELGRRGGIGRGRRYGQGRFKLTQVFDAADGGQSIYDGETKMLSSNFSVISEKELIPKKEDTADELKLKFITPVRIKKQGRFFMKDRKQPLELQLLIENLYRRIYCLVFFHCESLTSTFEYPQIAGVGIKDSKLRWQDWERYSNRQQTRMMLGGFVGHACYDGAFQPWLTLIRAGEFLHVGKGTAFGLGKYGMWDR